MYSDKIAKLLEFELYYDLFHPLIQELSGEATVMTAELGGKAVEVRYGSRWNRAGSALEEALRAGRVTYKDGYFYGQFNAAIARELRGMGAGFNATKRAYLLKDIPIELKSLILSATAHIKDQADRLQKKLDELKDKKLEVKVAEFSGAIFGDLDKQFVRTVTPADIEVPLQMTQGIADALQKDYYDNINIAIKGWREEQIERLRDKITANVTQGYRADKMRESIEAEYGVTKNKARFIARQETSLLVSKYREQRYKESGIRSYRWSTSHDERVRETHKHLDGRVFSFDSPPVVDLATGKRGNPGEDFNCRCVAIPILNIGG